MQSIPNFDIIRAEHCHELAMVHVFLNSFDFDESVKVMYTKHEIGPVIQKILHDYMDNNRIDFRLAVTQDSGLVLGWMSYGIIPATGPVPQFAYNEMTSWAAQILLRGSMNGRGYRLAVELEDRSRQGQGLHMPRHRFVINTIVTYPNYRRLGIATKLSRFAVDRVQSTDWGIWVQTPAVYEGLFWRNGFHEVGAFGLDLNAYKSPEEVALGIHGKQLGVQTWKHMKLGTRAEALVERARSRTAETGSSSGPMPDPTGAFDDDLPELVDAETMYDI